jgi:NADH-quinone oxidoreductase subunit A
MPRDYLPILLATLLALAIGGALIGLSALLGRVRNSRTSRSTYESGAPPVGNARERFSIKFYLVAVPFILFDVEVVFLFPWAASFGSLGLVGLVEMLIFVAVLVLGLAYAWRKGALEWE